jgi:hypothetical protein
LVTEKTELSMKSDGKRVTVAPANLWNSFLIRPAAEPLGCDVVEAEALSFRRVALIASANLATRNYLQISQTPPGSIAGLVLLVEMACACRVEDVGCTVIFLQF